jgi:para-aminobenzoate synthetase component 1
VEGVLRPDADAVDLLRATFPGGSITGAPKIRAMEIIAELEPTRRGPYCGALLWLGLDGAMDSAITIRTLAIKGRKVAFQAGGGIVADSEPAAEYAETLDKARALLEALAALP